MPAENERGDNRWRNGHEMSNRVEVKTRNNKIMYGSTGFISAPSQSGELSAQAKESYCNSMSPALNLGRYLYALLRDDVSFGDAPTPEGYLSRSRPSTKGCPPTKRQAAAANAPHIRPVAKDYVNEKTLVASVQAFWGAASVLEF